MAAGKKPGPSAGSSDRVRVRVRIDPSRIAPGMDIPVETLRRYRLGLGPFSVRPVEIVVTPKQAEALRDDPVLAVEDVTD